MGFSPSLAILFAFLDMVFLKNATREKHQRRTNFVVAGVFKRNLSYRPVNMFSLSKVKIAIPFQKLDPPKMEIQSF